MVFANSSASDAPDSKDPLIELLARAGSSLTYLRERAGSLVTKQGPLILGFCPRQMWTLCGILDEGRANLQRRLEGLLGPGGQVEFSADSNPTGAMDNPAAFMAEYRGCCRRLCKALNEARRISDVSSCAMLSELVLRLEKQLWLMDTPEHDPGTERYRSVSLFLTC
jgi:hypothetical protein